jgi:hypothetical protein
MYQFLNLSRREIRLLRIAPGPEGSPIEISTFVTTLPSASVEENGNIIPNRDKFSISLGVCQPYEALSYEWGDPDSPRHSIMLDRQPFEIRRNLFLAMICLRRELVTEALWIDAICINQADHRERGHQVQMMGSIYQCAQTVRVWLGADIPSFSDASRFVDKVVIYSSLEYGIAHGFEVLNEQMQNHMKSLLIAEEGWQALAEILEQSYWSRIWIIQEYLLAADVIIFCSHGSMLGQDLKKALRSIYKEELKVQNVTQYRHRIKYSPGAKLISMCKSMSKSRSARTLLELLEKTKASECQDPHDRIYAIIGLAEDIDNVRCKIPIAYDVHLQIVKADVISALKDRWMSPNYTRRIEKLLDQVFRDNDDTYNALSWYEKCRTALWRLYIEV